MRVSSSTAGAKLVALLLLTIAGLVASATAATVYSAGEPQRRAQFADRTKRPAVISATPRASQVRALIDSIIEPLAPFKPIDSAVAAQMIALVTKPNDSAVWVPHSGAPPSSTALATYRAWARSEELPPLWAYRAGFPSIRDYRTLPIFGMQPLGQLRHANELAADSALAMGDMKTALTRARENVAASRQILSQPFTMDLLIGRVMLRESAKLLARVALEAGEPEVNSAAKRLLNESELLHGEFSGMWEALVRRGAAPDDQRLFALAAERNRFPAMRALAIDRMVADMCFNTRDVIFGPSQSRYDAVKKMVASMSDVPRFAELGPLFEHTLATFDTAAGSEVRPPRVDEPASRTLFRLIVPTAVYQRVEWCRQYGG